MRCPVCRADDNFTDQCRRCKADLRTLLGLERDRDAALAEAELRAGRGEGAACLAAARRAYGLRAGADSLRLMALGALLAGDFAGAMKAFCRRMAIDPKSNEKKGVGAAGR